MLGLSSLCDVIWFLDHKMSNKLLLGLLLLLLLLKIIMLEAKIFYSIWNISL